MVRFLAIADFGTPTREVKLVANAMAHYAQQHQIDCVFGVGDNFYPTGVYAVDDPLFDSVWRDVFVWPHAELQVPWYMALGNHDYDGIVGAQIDYTSDRTRNADGLWQMPDRNYAVSLLPSVDVFVLDSNGAQWSVRSRYPFTGPQLRADAAALEAQLRASTADWKIVVSHHPLYTQGKGHHLSAECMRSDSYHVEQFGAVYAGQGFGLEAMLVRHGVDLHLAGHEHIFQLHSRHGVAHVGCGASGAERRAGDGFYRGYNSNVRLDWVASGSDFGFVAIEIDGEQMVIQFISHDGAVLREHSARRRSAAEKAAAFQRFQADADADAAAAAAASTSKL